MTEQRATGTNRSFEHVETTSASRSAIWDLWTDVASWKRWDEGLSDATIDGPFVEGAVGTIVPTSARAAQFRVDECDVGESYVFATALPGAKLRVRRSFVDGPNTSFRHQVWFDGPLARVWSVLLGRTFRRQLPPTMRKLAREAEA